MNFGWPSPMNMIVYGSNRHLWNEGKRKGFLFVAYRSANTHKSLEAPASKRSVGGGQFASNKDSEKQPLSLSGRSWKEKRCSIGEALLVRPGATHHLLFRRPVDIEVLGIIRFGKRNDFVTVSVVKPPTFCNIARKQCHCPWMIVC
ncbi:hypothetical protein BGM21_14280 [Geobacillus thermoleovorans]|nr:hypothetical protein BGM21_14280 [Geobacillus thermoleovorans]